MRKLIPLAAILSLLLVPLPVRAWFNGGHMVVAYIAYQNLSPETRSRIDDLLKLNEMYAQWTAGVAGDQKPLVAFVKAATWPDCIKQKSCSPGYTSVGGDTPPGDSTDAQNIGYSISSSESDNVRSYDVVWLEHLVGDVHQPLHATSRFTKNHPNGDAGGNLVYLCAKPCKYELHVYWDGLLGDDLTIDQAKQTVDSLLMAGEPKGADNAMPRSWANESFDLAKSTAYAKPISSDNRKGPSPRPDANYEMNANSRSAFPGDAGGIPVGRFTER